MVRSVDGLSLTLQPCVLREQKSKCSLIPFAFPLNIWIYFLSI